MRISAIDCQRLQIPLRRPFRTALRSVQQVDDLVLRLHSDSGLVGHGSAPATPQITGADHAQILADWRRVAPTLLGREVAELQRNCAWVQAEGGCSNARAAIDMALHDLRAQQLGLPLHELLRQGLDRPSTTLQQRALHTDLTISADSAEAMVSDCLVALAEGYTSLKIKLGREPAGDLARLRAIHAAVGTQISLRLDANQGWQAAPAIELMRVAEAEGVSPEWLEQPLPAEDLPGMAAIAARLRTPLLADESVHDVEQLPALLAARAARLINLKLSKAGGLSPTLQLAAQARQAGLGLVVGCMLESPIAVAAAAHLALACGIDKVDLDAVALARFDPVGGNTIFGGPSIRFEPAPGLGIGRIDGLQALGESWS